MAWGKSENVCHYMDGGTRTHDPKTHGPADDAICCAISGVLGPFDHLQKVTNNSSPKLSFITCSSRLFV